MADRVFTSALISSDSANNLSDTAERLFLRIVVSAGTDQWGRRDASPRRLRADCVPLLDWDDRTITSALEELVREGMVDLFVVDGRFYLSVCNWDTYQRTSVRLRRGKSRFPAPEEASDRRATGERPASDRRSPGLISSSRRDSYPSAVVQSQSELSKLEEPEELAATIARCVRRIPRSTSRTGIAIATVMRKHHLPEAALHAAIEEIETASVKVRNPPGLVVAKLEEFGRDGRYANA